MSLRAGKLNRQIVVEKKTSTWGGADTWSTHAAMWADFRAPTGLGIIGGQFQSADATVSRVQYSVRVRYRTDITADMRIVSGGIVYEIRQVIPDVAGRVYTDIVVATGGNQG